jgi:phosphoglycerate dehydrogenase-like enzyme
VTEALLPIHIKNNRAGEEVFRLTLQQYEAAAARHPFIASRVQATIDFDLDCFDESMTEAVGLVTWDLPTEALAERAPKLRWIHVIGAGVDHLQPLDWLPRHVILTNNRGVHAKKAGEYGIMAILMLNNALPQLMTQQRFSIYEAIFSSTVAGKTLLIVGLGEMGGAVARQARRLGLYIIGIRRRARPSRLADECYGIDALDSLLPRADFVLVTAPHTKETEGLIDARRLGLMKSSAGLINMSRASVIDTAALIEQLESGQLSGAVLDVFDPEPLPAESPLWHTPNLIMTPHVSSDDLNDYVPRTLDLFFANMARSLSGKPLRNRVRPKLGY